MWKPRFKSKTFAEGMWTYVIEFYHPTENPIEKTWRDRKLTDDAVKRRVIAYAEQLNAPIVDTLTIVEGQDIDTTPITEPLPTQAELRKEELLKKVAIIRHLQQDVRDGFVTAGVQAKITELLTEINGLTEVQKRQLHGYNELLGI